MATQVSSGPPASARPSGTVTFLFSDIEGSTARWDRDSDIMAAALERHDALMRAALEARGAYIFKTVGDAFCAAFSTARDAITAALDAQRALAAEDFSAVDGVRVRMALHTGRSDERDGDYFGPAVNRVARLLAIGHGGQVLVSGVAADLLQGEMPPESSLRDLGAHRLRDLARPEQVYQLIALDLPETFPTLRSLDELPNNLPRQLTSFVGRDDVVAEVAALIEKFPLVTLVGTGGAGKTRCAVQVGAEVLDGSGDGVWLAELAPINDPSLVATVIAQALNVQGQANRPMLETLLAFLKRKRLLLILDNCEHVVDEARKVVAAILHACPDVRILATSREGLNTAGEHVYRMPSLPVPAAGAPVALEAALRYGAVALFADRAMAADGRFALSDDNATYVAEICRRLDGIPLAIELAAARVKVLSPQQLAQKLDERFRVLTGGDRTALPRQQTMRALIDWSYDLLSDDERTLFRKLSIFAGGFTLETAGAIGVDEITDEIAVLDLLSSLVDKSLVAAELVGSGTRYRLLESTREYAREKLTDAGEYEVTSQAHAAAFLALAEELDQRWESKPNRAWLAQSWLELENFRAALEWALVSRRNVQLGQRLVGVLQQVWSYFAMAEGRAWVTTAQSLIDPQTPSSVIASLDLTEAAIASALTQNKASALAAQRALTRYREVGDQLQIAHAELSLGRALTFLGNLEQAEALLTQALASARALGARNSTVGALRTLADARDMAGDIAGARQLCGEALAIARAIGAERMVASITANLAETEFHGENVEEALRLASEALAIHREHNSIGRVVVVLSNIAAYLTALARYDEARVSAREALAAARDIEYDVGVAFLLQHLAAIGTLRPNAAGLERQDRARASRILGYVDARYASLGALREYTEQQEYERILPILRDALGADECARLGAEGSAWSEDQAVAEALQI
jgi:predicted ATPase/class 3 adenylate cyclase